MNSSQGKSLIRNPGQLIDRLQLVLKSQPSSLNQPYPPLKKELEDLLLTKDATLDAELKALIQDALKDNGASVKDRVQLVLTALRAQAKNSESNSHILLFFGPPSNRLSDLRAIATDVNALVFQTENPARAKQYMDQLPVELIVVDLALKKSDLQEQLAALTPEDRTSIPFYVCGKKPRSLFGKSDGELENIHYMGVAPDHAAIKSAVMSNLQDPAGDSDSTHAATLLDREQLTHQVEFFKTNNSVWSFGWFDAREISPEDLSELEDNMIELFRSSDVRGIWEKGCYVVLLPHTDSEQAQIALEKFFVKALHPPVTPLRMAIVHGHAEAEIEKLIEEAQTMLRKDASSSSEPALLSAPPSAVDRTLSCLLLDDSPNLFHSLRELTKAEGLDISQSLSSVDALKKTGKPHPYQILIVTDTLLKKDGMEWIDVFRETPTNNRIPILLIADPLPDEKIHKLHEYGITHIIHRPIDTKELGETVYLLLSTSKKTDGAAPPAVLCTSEASKVLLALSMVLYRETGLPLHLSKGWKDSLNRLYQDSPELVIMDIQESPEDALSFLTATRDFKVSPKRGYLVILPSEQQGYRDAFQSFPNTTILDGPVDPQDLPAHVRIKLKLAPLRRYPPDDKRFQLEVSRVMQSS